MIRSTALRRFFILYVSFSLILALILIPIYRLTLKAYADNCIATCEATLKHGVRELESDVSAACSAVMELMEDSGFRAFAGSKMPDTSEYVALYNQFEQFKRTMSFRKIGTDCGLIFPSGLTLTSKRIYYSGQEMFDRFLCFDGYESFDDWYRALMRYGIHFLPLTDVAAPSGSYRAVTLSFRLTSGNAEYSAAARKMVFFCTYSQEHLLDLLMLTELFERNSLTIEDMDGNVVFDNGKPEHDLVATVSTSSAALGLTISMGISKTPFEESLEGLYSLIRMAFISFIAVSVLLTVCYARTSSRPVRRVVMNAAGAMPDESREAITDEYRYLNGFIHKTASDLESYRATVAQQNKMLGSMILRQCFDKTALDDTFLKAFAQYFPDFPAQYVLALAKPTSNVADLDARAGMQIAMLDELRRILPGNSIIQPTSYNGTIAAIIPVAEEDCQSALAGCLNRLSLDADGGYRLLISEPAGRVEDLPFLYRRLQLMSRATRTILPFIFVKDADEAPANLLDNVVKSIDERFTNALMYGDIESALQLIAETFALLDAPQGISEQVIACAFHAYLCRIVSARSALHFTGSDAVQIPEYDPNKSLPELRAELEESVRALCATLADYRAQANDSQQQNVISYINQHLSDPMLCAQSVMDYFEISDYALQRMIRQSTGMTFFEYLDSRRMNRARVCLTETDMPIASVIQECGYSSRNTFYRAFKRTFGVSPSGMRSAE